MGNSVAQQPNNADNEEPPAHGSALVYSFKFGSMNHWGIYDAKTNTVLSLQSNGCIIEESLD